MDNLSEIKTADLRTDYAFQALNVIFTGPPGPGDGCRFVEVENDDGQSVSAGVWSKRPDGYWVLRIDSLPTVRLS